MPVTIQRKKQKVAQVAVESALAEAVDTYGALKAQIDKTEAELKQTKKALAAEELSLLEEVKLRGFDATETCVLEGNTYYVDVGAKAKKSEVTDTRTAFKMFEEISEDTPWEVISFKISDLRKYLNPYQLAKVLTENHTGRRTLKAHKK